MKVVPATTDGFYSRPIADLRGRRVSGVYVLFRDGEPVYVGESHTGRLFDTLTRHFREWRLDPEHDAKGRRRGDTMYDRFTTDVLVVRTNDAYAPLLQDTLIALFNPRDNAHA